MKLAYKNDSLANVYQRTLKNKVKIVLLTSVSKRRRRGRWGWRESNWPPFPRVEKRGRQRIRLRESNWLPFPRGWERDRRRIRWREWRWKMDNKSCGPPFPIVEEQGEAQRTVKNRARKALLTSFSKRQRGRWPRARTNLHFLVWP
jgi:hypothetical protein